MGKPYAFRLVGGPFPTLHPLCARVLASQEPPWFCGQDEEVGYLHYQRTGVNEYTYVGPCSEVDHHGACSHDHGDPGKRDDA